MKVIGVLHNFWKSKSIIISLPW